MAEDQAPKVATEQAPSAGTVFLILAAIGFIGVGCLFGLSAREGFKLSQNVWHEIFAALLVVSSCICFVGGAVSVGFACLLSRR